VGHHLPEERTIALPSVQQPPGLRTARAGVMLTHQPEKEAVVVVAELPHGHHLLVAA
jgi:hypothetical protein